MPSLPNLAAQKLAFTPTSRRRLNLRSPFSIDEKRCGPAVGWNVKLSAARRARRVAYSRDPSCEIRGIVRGLAEEANLEEPEKFAQAWHMLMEGSIVSAGEGNRNAARDAKCAAQLEHVPPELKSAGFSRRSG